MSSLPYTQPMKLEVASHSGPTAISHNHVSASAYSITYGICSAAAVDAAAAFPPPPLSLVQFVIYANGKVYRGAASSRGPPALRRPCARAWKNFLFCYLRLGRPRYNEIEMSDVILIDFGVFFNCFLFTKS